MAPAALADAACCIGEPSDEFFSDKLIASAPTERKESSHVGKGSPGQTFVVGVSSGREVLRKRGMGIKCKCGLGGSFTAELN